MKKAVLAAALLGTAVAAPGGGSARAWPLPEAPPARADAQDPQESPSPPDPAAEPAADLTVNPAADLASTEPAEAPLAEPGSDDHIDLGLLDLDPTTQMFDDSLQLYGFADFTWLSLRSRAALIPKTRSFGVGKLNFYLRKNLSPRWRSLLEFRLLFAPNGAYTNMGTYIDNAVSDAANFERPIRWGGVSIERAYLEYDLTDWLTVRAGRWLTPYGIWNIDHGSPTVIGANRPYIVGEQFFPEQQTGIEAFGSRPLGDSTVAYHLTFSNGRSPYESTRDPDMSPALGARLALETPMIASVGGTLRLGVSGYAGRATDAAITSDKTTVQYDELSLGVDASWDLEGMHVQAELLTKQLRYDEGKRPMQLGGGFAPDRLAWGAYGLAGYRFASWGNVMPYLLAERYRAIDPTAFGEVWAFWGGLNFRPLSSVTLKAELLYATFSGGGLYGDGDLDVLRFQSAWVF